ncbi:hypothetical protein ILUMI_16669 [Ignelater luminosus]|uniref:Anaphase-promoting complex subunit CDC26 n=1 Tax=Ignelater luminosus TaxID=2038154 RepID=A0A8K0CRV8_IGNLU|nr:hypothetical protein ILUMI_16669 [Ignelater luminosus]
MIRRFPTSIELKLDDVVEYETMRKEQEAAREQQKNSKPYNEPPCWQAGPKSKQEIHARIGYLPQGYSPK